MPFSQTSQLSPILRWTEELGPKSVLDVGAGLGQYGFLLRTRLEGVNLFKIEGDKGWQRPKAEWNTVIDGIEGFAGYMTPVHEWAYNQVLIGEALQLLGKLQSNSYELVLAIDILEHFDKEQGRLLVQEICRVASKAALISTPKEFEHQEVPANPYENHRSLWTQEELSSFGFVDVIPNSESWLLSRAVPLS